MVGNPLGATGDLDRAVGHWVAAGIISVEQGHRILSAESLPPGAEAGAPAAPASSLVTEALAYIGGAITLAAVGWATVDYWADLDTAARLGLLAAVVAMLLGAGAAVPLRAGEVARRLRSVLWVLSVAALSGFAAVLAIDAFAWSDDDAALFASVFALCYAGLLWWSFREPFQHAVALTGVLATAGTATGQLPVGTDALAGLAVCGAGAAWLVLSWARAFSQPVLGMVLGAAGAVVGVIATGESDWGNVLAVVVLVLLALLGVLLRSLPLLAVAAVGALLALPPMMDRYFEGSTTAALTLVSVGLVMVGAAIHLARRQRRPDQDRPARGRSHPSRTAGVVAAACIVAATTAAVVTLGS